MQFIAFSRRKTELFSDADFVQHIEFETERARTLYAEGFIRQIWHRGDVAGAALLLEAENETAVRAMLGTLPLVANGMIEFPVLVPLKPYAGFGPRGVSKPVAATA